MPTLRCTVSKMAPGIPHFLSVKVKVRVELPHFLSVKVRATLFWFV